MIKIYDENVTVEIDATALGDVLATSSLKDRVKVLVQMFDDLDEGANIAAEMAKIEDKEYKLGKKLSKGYGSEFSEYYEECAERSKARADAWRKIVETYKEDWHGLE